MSKSDPIPAEFKRTIEVNGQKFEVDTRGFRAISEFKVGSRIKILIKKWGDTFESHPGVIVGIDNFKNLPTIIIAYVSNPLSATGEVTFAYFNTSSKDIEICPMEDCDVVPTLETIQLYFDRSIAAKQLEIDQIRTKKEFFLRQYGTAFGLTSAEMPAAPSN